MADKPTRRAPIGGSHRAQVDAALRARDERLAELQREARELADRVARAEHRMGLRQALRPAIGTERDRDRRRRGAASTAVRSRSRSGPLHDFAQLTRFEDAVASIDSGGDVTLRNFADGRATFSVTFAEPLELVKELEQRAPFPFSVRTAGPDGIVLDVGRSDETRQTA